MRHLLPLFTIAALVLAVPAFAAAPYIAPGDHNSWDLGSAPQLLDDGVAPDVAAGDGIHTVSLTIANPGVYNFLILEATVGDDNDAWLPKWLESGNSWYITTVANEVVIMTFDENSYGDGWDADSFWPHTSSTSGNTYTLVGDIGSELGGNDWDPAGALLLTDDGLGGDITANDGIYTFCGTVSTAGTYGWKIAVNGDWAQQFGADGPGVNSNTRSVTVDNDNDFWCFLLDLNLGRVTDNMDSAVQIDNSTWGQLKGLYR